MTNSNKNNNNDELQLVPETLLKKRHDLDDLKRKRAAQVRKTNKVYSKSGKFYVRKPETYLARAKSRRNHTIRYKRVMRKGMQKRASDSKQYDTIMTNEEEDEEDVIVDKNNGIKYQRNSVGSKMVFVVRIRNDVGISDKVKTILRNKLGLKADYQGIFLRYTPRNRKLLHCVEPWIIYGQLSKGMVSDLINRRGYGRINGGERVPLTDNTIIEKALGDDSGIICVEDLVHEIHSSGKEFRAASSFLWPFRLTAPKTLFETQKLNDKEGRIYGDRGEEIDKLVKQML